MSERIAFAENDFLTRYPAGHHYDLRIETPVGKPGWKPRSFSPIGQSMFPGTAIEFEGIYYEIIFQDYDSGPPEMNSYYLKRWDNSHVIRTQFHYSEEQCRKDARALRERKRTNKLNVLLTVLAPLPGMLPAEDQLRISNRFGISATRMTFLSAFTILWPGAFLMVLYIAHVIGEAKLPGPPWLEPFYPAGFYFFMESVLRLFTAWKLEEPIGSLPVSFPILCWRSIRRSFDPAYRQKQFERMEIKDEKYQQMVANARDEIIAIASEDYDLEVISVLPKNHWNARLGIGYNGDWYGLVGSEKIQQGKNVRFRYFLKKAGEGTWFATAREYHPEEVQILYKEKRRTDLKTWADTFAPLWGLLPREDQIRLEEMYDFDALKFTKLTTLLLGLAGSINLALCLGNMILGVAGLLDAWLFLPALFLTLESFSRWMDSRKGEPSGSWLGNLVRPFARKILQGP